MTMLSFRIEENDAVEMQRWADKLGLDRSELLRDAVRRHLAQLRAEDDVMAWEALPLSQEENSFEKVADWGPAEDWTDWADAKR